MSDVSQHCDTLQLITNKSDTNCSTANYGCASQGDAMWVSHGCRGAFQCGTQRPLVRCGNPRHMLHQKGETAFMARVQCSCRPPFRFYGQGVATRDAEDAHVFRHYFSHDFGHEPFSRNGTFVEMGALDGVSFSNTLFFEKELGWSGLLIEPSHAFKYLQKHRGNNPRNTLSNRPICDLKEVSFADNMYIGALHMSAVAGLVQTMPAHHFQHYHRSRNSSLSQVKCGRLDALLRSAGIERIDFFSLDTEGSELSVLETMNWTVPIEVLVVELDGTNRTKDEAVRSLLKGRGGMRRMGRMGFNTMNDLWLGGQRALRQWPAAYTNAYEHSSL